MFENVDIEKIALIHIDPPPYGSVNSYMSIWHIHVLRASVIDNGLLLKCLLERFSKILAH